MKYSQRQSSHPNAFCDDRRDDESQRETRGDGGSLLQTLCRAIMNGAMILAFVAIILFAAYDMPVHSIASGCIFGFFAFAAAICSNDLD